VSCYCWTDQPVEDQEPHFLLCYRKSHIIHMDTHKHHHISSLLTHIPLLSQIYCKYHTPTWQWQNFTRHLLFCMLLTGTYGNYIRAASNRAMSRMRLASRAVGWPLPCYFIQWRSKMKMNLYLNAFWLVTVNCKHCWSVQNLSDDAKVTTVDVSGTFI